MELASNKEEADSRFILNSLNPLESDKVESIIIRLQLTICHLFWERKENMLEKVPSKTEICKMFPETRGWDSAKRINICCIRRICVFITPLKK